MICLRDDGQPARERHRGVEIHRLPVRLDKRSLGLQLLSYLRFLTRATVRLGVLHTRDPYRTVQVHNLPDFLVLCALVPKLRGAPVILDLHDLMPEFYAGRFGAGPAAVDLTAAGPRWLIDAGAALVPVRRSRHHGQRRAGATRSSPVGWHRSGARS